MATFRIETVRDPASGKIFVEVYYPDNAAQPFMQSRPIYDDFDQAEAGAKENFKKWLDSLDSGGKSN